MPQFALFDMTRVNITNVNIRSEMHGEDHVPAADISIKLTGSNELLDHFDTNLLLMFYKAAERADGAQAEIEGTEISSLPLLRTALVKMPIKLNNEYAGYEFEIDRGLGGKSNLTMRDAKVDGFKADLKEGGSIELTFRVAVSKLSADTLGKLGTMIGSEVSIVLVPPQDQQQAIDGTVGHPALAEAVNDATDTFLTEHGGDMPPGTHDEAERQERREEAAAASRERMRKAGLTAH